MSVLVDTSALFAVLDADDQNHERAKQTWVNLITHGTELACTSYVLVETFALVQHRLGMEAVRVLQEDVAPVLHVEWVDGATHEASGLCPTRTTTTPTRTIQDTPCDSTEMSPIGLSFTATAKFTPIELR